LNVTIGIKRSNWLVCTQIVHIDIRGYKSTRISTYG